MTAVMTQSLHSPPCQPSNSIPHKDSPIFHAKLSTMSSTLYSLHPLRTLYKSPDWVHYIINIKEVCNGVIHSMTKETITKYTKLMNDPDFNKLWVPAMSKELHWLAQGKKDITIATNAIFFLSHDKIRHIPKDRTITYTCSVIGHWPQKDNPNCDCITVGGKLVNYPYELTTQTADTVSSKKM
jgi:hypothetical protein